MLKIVINTIIAISFSLLSKYLTEKVIIDNSWKIRIAFTLGALMVASFIIVSLLIK